MTRKVLPLLFLLLSGISIAQTTTTYPVTGPSSGVSTYPARFFNIPLSLDGTTTATWLEVGAKTSCYGQTVPAVGFLFITLNTVAQPCLPLTGSPGNNFGTFAGLDVNGNPISGTYSLVITTKYRCSGGKGGGGCRTVYTIQSGYFTITQ